MFVGFSRKKVSLFYAVLALFRANFFGEGYNEAFYTSDNKESAPLNIYAPMSRPDNFKPKIPINCLQNPQKKMPP